MDVKGMQKVHFHSTLGRSKSFNILNISVLMIIYVTYFKQVNFFTLISNFKAVLKILEYKINFGNQYLLIRQEHSGFMSQPHIKWG